MFNKSINLNPEINTMPSNINKVVPNYNADAKEIIKLVKSSGKVTGYVLADGNKISKDEGISMAKAGNIKNVVVAENGMSEYLRSLPDGNESNNLLNLPSITE